MLRRPTAPTWLAMKCFRGSSLGVVLREHDDLLIRGRDASRGTLQCVMSRRILVNVFGITGRPSRREKILIRTMTALVCCGGVVAWALHDSTQWVHVGSASAQDTSATVVMLDLDAWLRHPDRVRVGVAPAHATGAHLRVRSTPKGSGGAGNSYRMARGVLGLRAALHRDTGISAYVPVLSGATIAAVSQEPVLCWVFWVVQSSLLGWSMTTTR